MLTMSYFSSHFKHITAKKVQFGASLIIKWEEFPALVDLITSADFNRFEAGDNRFQKLSRFPALVYMYVYTNVWCACLHVGVCVCVHVYIT